jgi:hypothetical protein
MIQDPRKGVVRIMGRPTRSRLRATILASVLVVALASTMALAGVSVRGKVLTDAAAEIPIGSSVRVGYVDYGLPDLSAEDLVYSSFPFTDFQKRILHELARCDGLLIDVVGAAEIEAYNHFLATLEAKERSQTTRTEFEFGSNKPRESERLKNYDVRMIVDENAWAASDYEVTIEVRDWGVDRFSQRVDLLGTYVTLDDQIEHGSVTVAVVDLVTRDVMFSLLYDVAGKEAFDAIPDDFATEFEIAFWKQRAMRNLGNAALRQRD